VVGALLLGLDVGFTALVVAAVLAVVSPLRAKEAVGPADEPNTCVKKALRG
jgi:hypothetical protein